MRVLRELVLFESLFKASRWTWLFGWVFHVALLVVLLQHLRYVTRDWWEWVAWLHGWGHVASVALLVALGGLWARRLLVDRVRFISAPSDHLMLALIAAIVATGMAMKYLWPANVVQVKDFVGG